MALVRLLEAGGTCFDYYSELLLSKQEVSLFCLSKGDQMAVGIGSDPGEPGLWAGRGESLRVSDDGIRRDRAGLSSSVISGAKNMSCSSDLPQPFAIAWNSTGEISFP